MLHLKKSNNERRLCIHNVAVLLVMSFVSHFHLRARSTLRGTRVVLLSRRHMSTSLHKVAVLYQAIEPPVINGVRKPKKPGGSQFTRANDRILLTTSGYRDSSADIAYVLSKAHTCVITPANDPDPTKEDEWCFPDTEEGILDAVDRGATHLWANTILFASHPLQNSTSLSHKAQILRVVGQPPQLVEQYDDKNFVNDLLRADGSFTLPKSWLVHSLEDPILDGLRYPVVAKPIRGRGSHGVKLCHNEIQLEGHLSGLLVESTPVMLEEFLAGQEGTVTVMPPSEDSMGYHALPIVVRSNHEDGIAPYNGVVAVTSNSRIASEQERIETPIYDEIEKACERVAAKLKVTAPIRIDVRQSMDDRFSKFEVFDVNMKPNMTGPGRPGRENQASLTALAAIARGWDYPKLLQEVLDSAQTLRTLRSRRIE